MKKYFKKGLAALLSVLISISTAFAVPVSVSALAETENFEKTTTPLPIGSDAINSANGFENLKIVPCEQLGGIYFINGNAVSFFNTDTGTTEIIATISNESYSFADSFSLGDKLYILEKNESDLALHSIITVYNLVTRSVEQTLSFENPAEVIGADDGGRIFLSHFDDESTMGITYLLSPSGEMLSSVSSKNKILYFAGLDSTNGNLFYVIYKSDSVLGTKNYLCTRVVSDDQIRETETEIEGIYTRTEIVEPAQLLQEKYMCIYNLNYSTYYKGATLNVFDSNKYNPDKNSPRKFIEQSINNEGCYESWGARGILYEEQKCFVCLKDSDTIGKYTLTPNDYSMFKINYELASIDTAHSIFSLLQFRNGIATIEKDDSNNFYYEFFPVKSAAYVQIEGDNSIQTGCNEQLRIKTDDTFNLNVKWESSNPEVVSVSEQGEVYAWKEGSADITTTTPNGLTSVFNITVTPNTAEEPEEPVVINGELSGKIMPSEQLNGLLSFSKSKLMLYITTTGQTRMVYDFTVKNYSVIDYYKTGNVLYILQKYYYGHYYKIMVYNLDTGKLERTIESEIPSDAIGADASGRIYLAGYDFEKRDDTYKIYLLTPSGELLSEIEGLNRIYEFVGFDSTNNNFYARADYDAPGSGYGVLAGNAENDKITVNPSCIAKAINAELINNKYLCMQNFFGDAWAPKKQIRILDSNSIDIDDTSIEKDICIEKSEFTEYGVGAGILENRNSVFVLKGKKTIAEYDLTTGAEIGTGTLAHPADRLFSYKGNIAAIETENGLTYYQYLRYKEPTEIHIKGETSVKMGTTEKYSISSDGLLTPTCTWTSSNPEIVTVNENNELFAWQEGSAKITATTYNGISETLNLTVTENGLSEYEEPVQIDFELTGSLLLPCDQLGGVYFIKHSRTEFINISTGESCVTPSILDEGYYYPDYCYSNGRYFILGYKPSETEQAGIIIVFNPITRCVEKKISFNKSAQIIALDESERIYLADNLYSGKYVYYLSPSGELLSETAVNTKDSIIRFADIDSANGTFNLITQKSTSYRKFSGKIEENKISVSPNYVSFPKNYPVKGAELSDNKTIVGTKSDGVFSDTFCYEFAQYYKSSGEEIGTIPSPGMIKSFTSFKSGIFSIFQKLNSSGELDYFYKYYPLRPASKISISGDAVPMRIGSSKQLTASTDGDINYNYIWKSSDPKIASVNDQGEVLAWKAGTVEITAMTLTGLTATFTVIVKDESPVKNPEKNAVQTTGTVSDNVSDNNYKVFGKVVNSYLIENSDGTLTRVEYDGSGIVVEYYSSDEKELISSKNIEMEMELFGGCYSGAEYNFLVFGQKNVDKDDDKEVLRVVKYSKDWKRLDSISYNGIDTVEPFYFASLRMTENDGRLYVHTCHQMYDYHQSNFTFIINESDMTAFDDSRNAFVLERGYVSHSLNQFIQTDGKYLYRVDHGDAIPRAITLVKSELNKKFYGEGEGKVRVALPISLGNVTGFNETGASVGGFELSENECIIAGNAVDYKKADTQHNDTRNIFISITDKNMYFFKMLWLTNYNSGSEITVYTPQLVKIDSNRFLVMWEEYNKTTKDICTKMVTIDNSGNITSEIINSTMRLSDCQPILCTDGLVRWYTSDDDSPVIYAVNPYDLDNAAAHYLKGDTNCDGVITITDVTVLQKYLANIVNFDEKQLAAADVDGDGSVTIADGTQIQKYLANIVTSLG